MPRRAQSDMIDIPFPALLGSPASFCLNHINLVSNTDPTVKLFFLFKGS